MRLERGRGRFFRDFRLSVRGAMENTKRKPSDYFFSPRPAHTLSLSYDNYRNNAPKYYYSYAQSNEHAQWRAHLLVGGRGDGSKPIHDLKNKFETLVSDVCKITNI